MNNFNLLELDTVKKRVVMSIDEFKRLVLKVEKWDMIQWAIENETQFIECVHYESGPDNTIVYDRINTNDMDLLKYIYEGREQNGC